MIGMRLKFRAGIGGSYVSSLRKAPGITYPLIGPSDHRPDKNTRNRFTFDLRQLSYYLRYLDTHNISIL
jgi:hypothetical protein